MFKLMEMKSAKKRLKSILEHRGVKYEEDENLIRIRKISESGFDVESEFEIGEIHLRMDNWHETFGLEDREKAFYILVSGLSKDSRIKVILSDEEPYFYELQHLDDGDWNWYSQTVFVPKNRDGIKKEKFLQNDIIEFHSE